MNGLSIGFGEEIKNICKKGVIYACLSGPLCLNWTRDSVLGETLINLEVLVVQNLGLNSELAIENV